MLQDLTQLALARALDATALRNRTIANNIANVETPNFRRQDVTFEDALRAELDQSDSRGASADAAVDNLQPQLVRDPTQPTRENGNNVDIDREMAHLAENTVHYNAVLQTFLDKDSMLRTAIYEGRK